MAELRDNRAYYDAFSDGYESERHHGYHLVLDELQEGIVQKYARPQDVALEIGCGTGLIMDRVARHVAELKGVDLSPGMLSKARERNLDVYEGSATELPFDDESFDLVFSFKVLAHVQQIEKAMAEAYRVLRSGGRAVLEFYNPTSLRGLRKRIFNGIVAPGTREGDVYTRFDKPDRIRTYFTSQGFTFDGFAGAMVVSPAAVAYRIPGATALLGALERACVDSPVSQLGGFLSGVGHKG